MTDIIEVEIVTDMMTWLNPIMLAQPDTKMKTVQHVASPEKIRDHLKLHETQREDVPSTHGHPSGQSIDLNLKHPLGNLDGTEMLTKIRRGNQESIHIVLQIVLICVHHQENINQEDVAPLTMILNEMTGRLINTHEMLIPLIVDQKEIPVFHLKNERDIPLLLEGEKCLSLPVTNLEETTLTGKEKIRHQQDMLIVILLGSLGRLPPHQGQKVPRRISTDQRKILRHQGVLGEMKVRLQGNLEEIHTLPDDATDALVLLRGQTLKELGLATSLGRILNLSEEMTC